jgi:CelD/BcsL family acetyltransferase involved in cellulose biosynthesis
MTGRLACHLIKDRAGLTAIEPGWWELWRQSPTATPFQSPGWLLPWWKYFAPGELCALAVLEGERLVGLAPLYRDSDSHGKRRVLPIGFPLTDYHDFLTVPEFEKQVLAAIRSCLAEGGFWDVLELPELPPDACALGMIAPAGCDASTVYGDACPILVLPQEIAEPERMFPMRKRRKLRTARHRAERHGPVRILTANINSILDCFEVLVALHRRRWRSRGEPGVLADGLVQEFHRRALPALTDAGLVRFYLLQIGSDTAAAYYGFHHRDQAYGYLMGFDPAYAFESPGVILLAHAITEAAHEGARKFHFLRGREPYKYEWGAHDCWNKCLVFNRLMDNCARHNADQLSRQA